MTDKYRLLPIQKPDLWKFYKLAVDSFWTPEEIKLDYDKKQWTDILTDNERHYLSHILAFFAEADGIVNENLLTRFMTDVQLPEAQYFYAFQMVIENIHSETYQLILDAYIDDAQEKERLLCGSTTIPVVQKKAEWAQKWISSKDATFADRLLAFICIEGIFFSGAFAAIFYIRKRGLLPGLTQANSFISRDEGLHQRFGCHLYRYYIADAEKSTRMVSIIKEAVEIEKEFQRTALPVSLLGMNCDRMCEYIEYIADFTLGMLGHPVMYGTANPFDFMHLISLDSNENFFEVKSTNYSIGASVEKQNGVYGSAGSGSSENKVEDDW